MKFKTLLEPYSTQIRLVINHCAQTWITYFINSKIKKIDIDDVNSLSQKDIWYLKCIIDICDYFWLSTNNFPFKKYLN